MDILDKVLKFCFILSILFFVFLFGFLANDLRFKRIYEGISFMINDVETRFNINLEKKFGDKVERNTNFWKKESKNEFLSNLNFYNKPREKFEHYLLIKHVKQLQF